MIDMTMMHFMTRNMKTGIFIRPSLLVFDEQRRIVAYLDGLQAKVSALWELQSQAREELSALMLSVLDRAFKGEL
jgi:type I restriction enzyme, S subunit